MKKKIKDLTLEEILAFNCPPVLCRECPIHIKGLGHCVLHIKPIDLRPSDLESEVEVDE